MNRSLYQIIFSGLLLGGIIPFSGKAQPFEEAHPLSYKKVFVETDQFGAGYLDTLALKLPKIKNDTLYFSVLNDLAYYWHTRNLDSALKYTVRGLDTTQKKKNLVWNGRFQITQGAILLRMERLDDAFYVLQQAKSKVTEADQAFLNTQLGYVFERRGQLDKAADYAEISLRYGEKLKDKKAIALAYSDLSNLFWKQNKFEKGLEFGLRSLDQFEARGLEDLDYDFTLFVVGFNYMALKKFSNAKNYFTRSIAMGEKYGFYNNLSDAYIFLAELNMQLKFYSEAFSAASHAIQYARLLDNNFMVMRSWLALGQIQYARGDNREAINSLDSCIRIATPLFGDKYYLNQAYQTLGNALARERRYKEAFEAYAKYDTLKGQLYTDSADQRMSLLQTQFDVKEKEITISAQRLALKQQRLVQFYAVSFIILLSLFLIFLNKALQINRRKNKLLEKQNKEKEFLLKEIHHRVKNNLEVVSSLVSLQTAQIKDPAVVEAMNEIQSRVYSMSMIHRRLYLGKNLATIEMKDYFMDLGKYVLEGFGAVGQITIHYDMIPTELDIDTAVPLGLIVNELLTNSLKHAFPGKKTGNVTLSLTPLQGSRMLLAYEDDGIGSQAKDTQKKGFGLSLIELLTYQISGKMEKKKATGTRIELDFKLPKTA